MAHFQLGWDHFEHIFLFRHWFQWIAHSMSFISCRRINWNVLVYDQSSGSKKCVTITWFGWVHYYWHELLGGNRRKRLTITILVARASASTNNLICMHIHPIHADIEFNRLRLKIQLTRSWNTESVIITRDQFSRSMFSVDARMRY